MRLASAYTISIFSGLGVKVGYHRFSMGYPIGLEHVLSIGVTQHASHWRGGLTRVHPMDSGYGYWGGICVGL